MVAGLGTVAVGLATFSISLHQRAGPHFAELSEMGFEFSISVPKFLHPWGYEAHHILLTVSIACWQIVTQHLDRQTLTFMSCTRKRNGSMLTYITLIEWTDEGA